MAETLLISLSEIRDYENVSANFDSNRLEPLVREVQRTHLRELLGQELYFDMFDKYPDGGVYDDLINGVDYTYNSETIYYYGIKPFLCYHWLAKAVLRNDFFVSDYGNVAFDLDSESHLNRASNRDRQAVKEQFLESATGYRNDIAKFLNNNGASYPLWMGKDQNENKTRFSMFHV